jgi:hypothetical protein
MRYLMKVILDFPIFKLRYLMKVIIGFPKKIGKHGITFITYLIVKRFESLE